MKMKILLSTGVLHLLSDQGLGVVFSVFDIKTPSSG